MTIRILLIADIHGNYPALQAIDRQLDAASFTHIVNCGDSLVYAPFANETLDWLVTHRAISILGNTDQKVIRLLTGKSIKKPRNPEKRIMYSSTAEQLNQAGRRYLLSLPLSRRLILNPGGNETEAPAIGMGVFHGSPADPDEFLFADTPDQRFQELAAASDSRLVVTGHSHSPYHKTLAEVHFINPGSAGRMFDGDPRASCAVVEMTAQAITVRHHRIAYDIGQVVARIREQRLPEVYAAMFLAGKKLN